MIFLLDVEKNNVTIYDEDGCSVFSASDITGIKDRVEGKTFLYVRKAEEVSGEDVISLLESLPQEEDNVLRIENNRVKKEPISETPQELFIHPVDKGYIRISDNLIFTGPLDIKPIREFGATKQEMFTAYPAIKQLMDCKKLEIINQKQAAAIIKNTDTRTSKDKSLDSIIVKGSVDEMLKHGILSSDSSDDPISIDLDRE